VLEDLQPKSPWLFMWRNRECVVVGRNQNPWSECALTLMENNNVTLSRRLSGGGAVYQDMGNTCFSFIFPEGASNITRNNDVVLRALSNKFDITGTASGRNDLTVNNRKFSGFAAKKRGPLWVHHGTLLRDVDMKSLGRYLTPNKAKLDSKGVKSVASRVVNLAELNSHISHDLLVEAIAEEFVREFGGSSGAQFHGGESVGVHSPEAADEKFVEYHNKLLDWSWRFGTTPSFTHKLPTKRFDWGTIDILLSVKNGHVESVEVFTDAMVVEISQIIKNALMANRYNAEVFAESIHQAANQAEKDNNDVLSEQLRNVSLWMPSAIDEIEHTGGTDTGGTDTGGTDAGGTDAGGTDTGVGKKSEL